jgi:hypothetical protein
LEFEFAFRRSYLYFNYFCIATMTTSYTEYADNDTDEKKTADSQMSEYLESVLWSDNPETAYFQQMLKDRNGGEGRDIMEDSILGDMTMASIMGGGRDRMNTEDDSNTAGARAGTPPKMAIVGYEDDDDLSTIANDTINGSVMMSADLDVDLGGQQPQQSSLDPTTRDFKEYSTPPKKKRNANTNGTDDDDNDDDEVTLPETPPGFIRVRHKSGGHKDVEIGVETAGDGDKESKASDNDSAAAFARRKKIFVCAAVTAALLVAAIGALAIILIQLRGEDDGGTATAIRDTPTSTTDDGDFNGFPSDTVFTSSPVIPPLALDSEDEPFPTPVPVPSTPLSPTSAPTEPTTVAPVPIDAQTDFLRTLASRSVTSLEALDDRQTPQYRSFEWISTDPKYFEYGPDRVIQRWVLGVMALGWSEHSSSTRIILSSWMTDTDECTWYSTRPDVVCNADGLYESLDIRDSMLSGTIPAEVALLSKSLSKYTTYNASPT